MRCNMKTNETSVNGKALNEVNYIQHLTGFYGLIAKDNRLTTAHISLYMALFQFWNMNRFQNPISISRNEMMTISKIGSTNTYSKCLKELDKFGYIQYVPSFNPLKGSVVNLFNLNTGSNKGIDTGTDKACERAVRPFINSINTNKQINIKTRERENSKNDFPSISKNEKKKMEKFCIPELEQIKSYFLEKENTREEAERFFNYFESNGWLVGGKTKMKDWKAAARNWMLRSKEFTREKQQANPLSTSQNKDYSIPL